MIGKNFELIDLTKDLIDSSVEHIYYIRKKGILPEIMEQVFNERKEYKNKMKIRLLLNQNGDVLKFDKQLVQEVKHEGHTAIYYDSQQYIRKILANSLYGILGSPYFHFYNIHNAKAITLGGQHLIKYISEAMQIYFKNHFYKNRKYFNNIDIKNKLKYDTNIIIDTDSCFLTFQEIIQKLGLIFNNDKEFLDWSYKFNTDFLEPFIKKLLIAYSEKWKIPNIINFKREKIANKMIVLAKKKYVVNVLDNEGITYKEPKLDIVGVEVVRSSTPKFCRDNIKDVVKEILKTNDKNIILNKIRKIRDDFKVQDISNIAFPRGISDYDKYCSNIDMTKKLEYSKGCPIANRAAINYNYIIKKYKLNLIPISNGTKVKFIFVKENNELNQNIIAFIGNWPKEFNNIFKIDYDEQFDKSFISVIERFFEVLNWGKVNLDSEKLNSLFSDD